MPTPLVLSARFGRRRARPGLTALYAVLDEIQTTLIATAAPKARRARIAFWQAEVAAAAAGRARHPLARALAQTIPPELIASEALAGALEAARDEAALDTVFPGDRLRTLLAAELGRPLGLAATLEDPDRPETVAGAERVGTAYALTLRLQTIGLAHRRRPWEIVSLAAQAGAGGRAEAAMGVLRDWAQAAYAQTGAPGLPPSVRVLAALGERLLAELAGEIAADAHQLLAGRIVLPGLRMRAIALRAVWGRL